MKLSRTVAYAIGATLQLASAGPDRLIPCKIIAGGGSMPPRFLLQILRSLVTHGVLTSARGVDGGYRLAGPPDQVTLLQIVEAFDNSLSPSCPDIPGFGSQLRRRLCKTLQDASESARRELRKLTLADLLVVQITVTPPKGLGTIAAIPVLRQTFGEGSTTTDAAFV